MVARLSAAFFVLCVVAGAIAGGGYLWFKHTVAAPGPLATETVVVIAPGTSLGAIANQLAATGVISHAGFFEWEARRSGRAGALKPGEYRFAPGISIVGALDKIVARDVVARFVTIPEGLVTADIIAILEAAPGLTGTVPDGIADGDLLPETYHYEWGDSRTALIGRMRAARDQALSELWAARDPTLPLDSPHEAVVLAAIVEKETGIAAERPRVAAVFINRLRRGMRLQSDPTVIYGLAPDTGDLDRLLTRADLMQATPFNTYVIPGLPPSPICHPGRAALAAVLQPIESTELYFVADGTGGHAFADTLQDHNRNVARWRRLQREGAAP